MINLMVQVFKFHNLEVLKTPLEQLQRVNLTAKQAVELIVIIVDCLKLISIQCVESILVNLKVFQKRQL